MPIHQYGHDTGECSITGGHVYRGSEAPELAGRYLFGDLCSGSVRALAQAPSGAWQVQPILQAGSGLTSFGEDASGELYLMVGHQLFRLVSDGAARVPAAGGPGLVLLAMALGLIGWQRRRSRR